MGSDGEFYSQYPLVAAYFSGNADKDQVLSFVFTEFTPYMKKIISERVRCQLFTETPEDVLSEACLKIFKNFDQYKGQYELKKWIASVVGNVVEDIRRKNVVRRRAFHDSINGVTVRLFICDNIDQRLDAEFLVTAIPKNFLDLFYRHYVVGESLEEIASSLNILEATLKTRLHRMRQISAKKITRALQQQRMILHS